MYRKPEDLNQDVAAPVAATLRTLIVGNNPRFCSVLSSYLTALDRFEIVGIARSGWDGLQMAEAKAPHLVLADFQIGDMTGAALAKALKAHTKPPIVVVMSRQASKDYVDITFKAGADGFLLKAEIDRIPILLQNIQARRRR
ncbi:MAG TPA: response regulator [Gammaproteobacteria bacterium]|jgi:DNA-binding NarL/FixJ family response regulator